ncbi:ABC transporter [Desulfosarcina alkanivorans]|uniref:ABC transporter n=2 Tax=Desulfosarcina alkanivorans TaxID=571177 RepID=A0A5K7YIW3_9BACT|nr:ABC transporter [Desulfosarcina alkanivorans]
MLAGMIVFDVLFSLPLLRWFRPPALPRWRKVSQHYREMAVEMGGVLIKLGQFVSTRVDLLPPEIIHELAGLQDRVAPARLETVVLQIEKDFTRPLADIFPVFGPDPIGSASLAQAHEAELDDGTAVVVKVLRPGIDILVATDLKVMEQVCRWLNRFSHIRGRMNLDQLMAEFTATTRRELDMMEELANLKRFDDDFRKDPHVYVPRVHENHCAPATLTMENVAYVKINDVEALGRWGIDHRQVADRLYDVYMKQIFITNFIHVDPHPGNLFIRPLPLERETAAGIHAFSPGDRPVACEQRPFQIVFIDFGMTAVIPKRFKAALRTMAIGVGTRDARKVVQAYVAAGVLQPGVDTVRLEAAHEDWFNRLWGIRMGKMHEVAYEEARYFIKEYRDLITEIPFQLQEEMLFVGRAVGILAGMATQLDPEFDPWGKTIPYARQFAREELKLNWKDLPEEVLLLGRHLLKIPAALDHVLDKARHGTLAIQVSLSPETRRAIKRIDLSVKRFAWMVLSAGLLVSGVNLYIAGHLHLGVAFMGLSILVFLWGLRKA